MNLDPVQRAARDQFARQSGHYGRGHVLEDVSDLRAAVAQLAIPCPAHVLDVAAGAGHTGLFFAALGHHVTLSDIAQPMLDRGAQAALERGLHVRTSLHTAEVFPHESASFDLVTCRVAAHHFSSPAAFVGETARVLRKRGWLLLIDGTVEDGQPEAEEWAHQVEKLRDPSHNRLVTPGRWRQLCAQAGLEIRHAEITPFKQPDLNWYFDAAATTPENRRHVLQLVAEAPESARRLFQLAQEDGKITWFWQRLTLCALRI
jgi:SAM-dependent methyltransferase